MKYRKKPVVVEAFQWKGHGFVKFPEWWERAVQSGEVFSQGKKAFIETLEGRMTATPSDYIIQGVNGEIYPCKADIFEKTYEAAE
jgi:hypothetical protein